MARQPVKSTVKALMEKLLADLIAEPRAWAFQHPVDLTDVTDYLDVIKQPMGTCSINRDRTYLHDSADLSTIQHKISTNQYKTFDSFVDDTQLVFDNCRLYNPENTVYAKNARFMDQFFKGLLSQHWKQEEEKSAKEGR
jgi:histone acetyltransferase